MVGIDINTDVVDVFDLAEDEQKQVWQVPEPVRFDSAVSTKTLLKASFALTDDAVVPNGPVEANHVT